MCGILPPASAAFPGVRSFLVCWLPLAFFPYALVLFGPVCPPRCLWSWLVLLAPSSLWFWFVLLAWPVFLVGLVCVVLLCVVWLVSRLRFAFVGFASRHSEQVHSYFLLPTKVLISAGYNLSPYRIRSKCQRDQATEQPSRNNNTNELRDEPTPNRKRREGGSQSGGCVCIVGSTVISHP